MLLVCELYKAVSSKGLVLYSKLVLKGVGREKNCLQHNITDLFSDIPTVPDRWSLHDEWTTGCKHTKKNTHMHK